MTLVSYNWNTYLYLFFNWIVYRNAKLENGSLSRTSSRKALCARVFSISSFGGWSVNRTLYNLILSFFQILSSAINWSEFLLSS